MLGVYKSSTPSLFKLPHHATGTEVLTASDKHGQESILILMAGHFRAWDCRTSAARPAKLSAST